MEKPKSLRDLISKDTPGDSIYFGSMGITCYMKTNTGFRKIQVIQIRNGYGGSNNFLLEYSYENEGKTFSYNVVSSHVDNLEDYWLELPEAAKILYDSKKGK